PEGETMPDGKTGKWQPELNQWFTGRARVNILEDNDAAGRAHTAEIIKNLRGTVGTIAVVSFPELPEHHDVSDWLAAGGNKQLLLARAEAAQKKATANGGPGPALESVWASEEKMEAIEWIWPTRFAIGKLGIIAGLPDEGKGQILSYVAAQITKGKLPWPC